MIEFQQMAAAIYLASGIGALLGIVLPEPRISRGAVWGLVLGAAVHALAFSTLHRLDPVPTISSTPGAISLMAWMAVLFLLLLMWRLRLASLTAIVGPIAFLSVFVSTLLAPEVAVDAENANGSLPHAHVLLSSAGLSLLGIAGLAGAIFLMEHRRIKRKRPVPGGFKLPSLEALDRVNLVSLAVGFVLLTLGVVTGGLWLRSTDGIVFSGEGHQTWTIVAWCIYAGLVAARFPGHQGARLAAASAIGGFAFLFFSFVGVELLS